MSEDKKTISIPFPHDLSPNRGGEWQGFYDEVVFQQSLSESEQEQINAALVQQGVHVSTIDWRDDQVLWLWV